MNSRIVAFTALSGALHLLLAGAVLPTPAAAEDPSVVLRSLDNLEKRLVKIEAETGKLKKGQAAATAGASTAGASTAAPEKGSGHSDSAVLLLSGRLDSLLLRLRTLETAAQAEQASAKADTAKASAGGTVPVEPASADLASEIRALTMLLKEERASAHARLAAPQAPRPAAAPMAAAPVPAPAIGGLPQGLELKGDIQIQGERKFTAQSERDNLDDFWGRLNFGAEYNQGDFQSKLNIRIFPEGFGFEPLTGATFDTAGQGALKVQSQPSSRIVINHAWAKYAVGFAKLKVGRFETVETQSDNFGNYVDLAPSGKFMSRPAVHNALETSMPIGPVASSIMLGTNDRKLNRGFLRIYEKYSPTPDWALSAGYRANLFDSFQFPDDEILQRYDAGIAWKAPIGWKAFAEAAVLQYPGRKDDTPVLFGIQPKTGKALDLLSVEVEYLSDRKAAGENKEWFFNLHARKAMGRFKLDAGCYSDPADADWNAASFGLRMTSNIK